MISNIRYLLIFLAGVLIGIFGLTSIYHMAYNQKIYPHVWVGQKEISNLKINQATTVINGLIPQELPMLFFNFGNQSWPADLKELKIEYLPEETAKEAWLSGRSQGFFKDLKLKWQKWRQTELMPIKFNLDQEKLTEMADVIASGVEQEPIMPAINLINNIIELMPGKGGRLVDRNELIKLITGHLGLLDFEPIAIPIKLVNFDISGEDLEQTRNRAENLKTKKLKLKYESFEEDLSGQRLIDLMNFSGGFDEDKIASATAALAINIDRPTQNAIFQFDGNKVVEFKPALAGIKLDQAVTTQLIKNQLESLDANENIPEAVVELVVRMQEPETQTNEINNLGIKELLGKGESYFYHSIPGRIHNVALTAAKLNGVLVAPGETFSFNQTVGDISRATGYQAAYVIQNGRTVLGDGGGVCQDSTTLFRAVLNAGLDIKERRAHAYRVSYYENNSAPGFDATVFAPSPDFKFINDTPAHILIQTTVDLEKLYLKIELYGTNDGRKTEISNIRLWGQSGSPEPLYQDDPTLPAGQIKQVDWAAGGAKAAFDWLVTRNGETLHQQTFYSNYQPWQAVYLRGTKI